MGRTGDHPGGIRARAGYRPRLRQLGSVLRSIGLLGVPITMGIAVLRYRLYDIDVLINRTLVYGALTATLALTYFGGVATVQAIFHALTGQEEQPQLAIVVHTLVVAALQTYLILRSGTEKLLV